MSGRSPSRTAAPPPRTAGEMLERSKHFLAGKGAEESRLDAELLVAHALGLDRLGLYMALDRPVTVEEIASARDLVARRGRGEPVAYLTGAREFYGRRFAVGPGCLVPRPETELIVDVARRWGDERSSSGELLGLDLGTGSGCLAVTLQLELEDLTVRAIERSAEALRYARQNARELSADVDFVEDDALGVLAAAPDASLDLVVSNPPYVDPADRTSLPVEVREHEPAEALFAPEGDPDLWARTLLAEAPRVLRPGGILLVELGADQGPRVVELAREIRFHPDLARHDRVLELRQSP